MVSPSADREISTVRVVNAPRDKVWKAFTDPAHVGNWWGPNGFTNTISEMDVRTGGRWRFVMHGPDGTDYPNRIDYLEVTERERLVYEHSDDAESPGQRFHVTITFEDAGAGKTRVSMTMLFATAEERRKVIEEFGATEGQKQTFDKLEAYLETM